MRMGKTKLDRNKDWVESRVEGYGGEREPFKSIALRFLHHVTEPAAEDQGGSRWFLKYTRLFPMSLL